MRGPASNVHFRNNLVIPGRSSGPVFAVRTYTNYSTSDYNGFRPMPGDRRLRMELAAVRVLADYESATACTFKTLTDYSKATGQETHSVLVDYNTFVHVTMPNKADPQHLYKPEGLDFRLKPGSPAIDAGVALPTINDGFTGRAPDLGAFELVGRCRSSGPRN